MADETHPIQAVCAVAKDVVSVLRDGVIFLLFILLLFAPGTINKRLTEAGFTKGSVAGFEWEAQIKSATETTKTAGQTVVQAAENYDALIERLAELEKRVTDTSVQSALKSIGAEAATSRAELATADQAIKRSLAVQQQIVTQVAPAAVADTGWLFLGKVNEEKTAWAPGSPQTVNATDPALPRGTKLVVRDDVYLRGDAPANARASAPVLAVGKVGDTMEVLAVDYSHARGGGWFVWAKVRRG